MSSDPLGPLTELPGVPEAITLARDAIADVHAHPVNRRGWPAAAAEASVRAARASAALAGSTAVLPDDGAVTEPILAGALRAAEALGGMLASWQRAPGQALARLHVLAAADLVDDDELGRPRAAPEVTARLDALAHLVTGGTAVPAPVRVAVVHGELLALAPFGSADGVVARAAARLTMVSSGLDPKALVIPEVAHLRQAGDYQEAVARFATGERAGLAHWIVHCCHALVTGAREARSIADALARA